MAGLFNIAAAGAPKFKELSHGISFGIMLAMTTNLAQYTFHKCAKRKYRTHLGRYWPAYSVALSAPLICADLVRHLLQDAGIWGAGSAMYNETCCDKVRGPPAAGAAERCREAAGARPLSLSLSLFPSPYLTPEALALTPQPSPRARSTRTAAAASAGLSACGGRASSSPSAARTPASCA